MKFKTPESLILYKWQQKWYNSFSIYLLFPSLEAGRYIPDSYLLDSFVNGFELILDTYIRYRHDDCGLIFSFRILGFGLSIGRQWSY